MYISIPPRIYPIFVTRAMVVYIEILLQEYDKWRLIALYDEGFSVSLENVFLKVMQLCNFMQKNATSINQENKYTFSQEINRVGCNFICYIYNFHHFRKYKIKI